MRRVLPFVCMAVLAASGCERRSEGMVLHIDGHVMTSPSMTPLAYAEVALMERAVEDGALQAEETIAETTSDNQGQFSFAFLRRSSYSLRWTAEAPHHFPSAGQIDPESLYPNAPFNLTVGMYPACTLHVNLASVAPEDSTDRILFNLGEEFNCDCCPTDPLLLEGVGADSSWTCLMYGDRWMTWGADLDVALIGQPDGLFVDSVFCPAFGSAELNLTW